jgi:hypothetical protein
VVRVFAVVESALNLATGVWAFVTPRNWYAEYPGLGHRWISTTGPFNEHLASDAGAGFIAVGVMMAIAALWTRRAVVAPALLTFLAQTVPHFLFHLTHPDPSLGSGDVLISAGGLGAGSLVALLLLALVVRRERRPV